MTTLEYKVDVHYEGAAGMWAEVVELPGCFASGFSLAELNESLRESIELYLSTPEQPVRVGCVHAPQMGRPIAKQAAGRIFQAVEGRSVELIDA